MLQDEKPKADVKYGIPYTYMNSLLGEFIYDGDIPREAYREMVERDETVAASLELLAYNVANRFGTYQHPDKNVQAFVRGNLQDPNVKLEQVITRLVKDVLVYGFAVAELVWKVKNDKYHLKSIIPLPPETVSLRLEEDKIAAIIQTTPKGKVEIPREKVVYLVLGNGLMGQSSLRRAWRAYRFKSVLFKLWALAMERYAMPILWGRTTDVETLLDKLANLWANGVIATDPNTNIDLLETRINIAGEFRNAIEYANILIARALLLPPLLITNERTGAYALGRVQMSIFMTAVERLAKLIADALVHDVIAKLISYNFDGVDEYGHFILRSQPTPEDMSRLAVAFAQLVGAGVLDPEVDGDWMKALIGAPRYVLNEGEAPTPLSWDVYPEPEVTPDGEAEQEGI